MGFIDKNFESISQSDIIGNYGAAYSNSDSIGTASIPHVRLTCADAIPINAGVSISDTGFALLATVQWVDNRELHGISKTAGNINGEIELYNDGEVITIDDAIFIPGKTVRLDINKNLTTDYLRTIGNFNHPLGTAISTKSFRLHIETPRRVM